MKLFGTIVYPKNRYLTLQFPRGGKNVMCEDYFDNMVGPSLSFVQFLSYTSFVCIDGCVSFQFYGVDQCMPFILRLCLCRRKKYSDVKHFPGK